MKTEVLAVIPARGGSKSIEYKNITKLQGKPLLWYVANAARQCNSITRLICSTEDDRIAKECKRLNIEVISRPDKLATDDAGIAGVLRHAIESLSTNEGYNPNLVARLLPTHPFLRPSHIDDLVEKIRSKQSVKSGQTLVKVPHHFHAYNQRTLDDNEISYLNKEAFVQYPNRQSKPNTYGSGNLCITKAESLFDDDSSKAHFAEPAVGMEIKRIYNMDIDEKEDLERAELYLENNEVTIP